MMRYGSIREVDKDASCRTNNYAAQSRSNLWGFQYLALANIGAQKVQPSHGVNVMTEVSKGVETDKYPPSIHE